jgi:hypothetical protein
LPGSFQAVAAGLADGFAAAFVFIVGGHVSDRFVKPSRIVFRSHPCQFGFQQGRVGDRLQVRPLSLDMAEERLDPGLIGGTPGRPWCWTMAINAMNARVSRAVIGGPLSM